MKDFRVRYLASYSGPSYDTWGEPEYMDAYKSIEAARDAFKARQKGFQECTYAFQKNNDDLWSFDSSQWVDWPATTDQDRMELYPVIGDGMFKTLQVDNYPIIRIVAGPRGGAIVERY